MATNTTAPQPALPMTATDECWYALPFRAACDRWGVDPESGLAQEVAQNRFIVMGPNRLSPLKEETTWDIFLEEVREPMIVLLLVTGFICDLG